MIVVPAGGRVSKMQEAAGMRSCNERQKEQGARCCGERYCRGMKIVNGSCMRKADGKSRYRVWNWRAVVVAGVKMCVKTSVRSFGSVEGGKRKAQTRREPLATARDCESEVRPLPLPPPLLLPMRRNSTHQRSAEKRVPHKQSDKQSSSLSPTTVQQ